MRKLKVVSSSNKTAAGRNQEMKDLLSSLVEHLSSAVSEANQLRNNFDDIMDSDKVRTLFDLSKKLQEVKNKL